jgi:hypothetical protein
MATTTNLQITLIEQSQSQKEVTANEAFIVIDKAIAGRLALTSTGGTTTLTDAQAANAVLDVTGALTSDATVVVPARSHIFTVRNDTSGAQALTVKTASGTGITVPAGAVQTLYCDGTNVYMVGAAAAPPVTTAPYDIGMFFPGKPADGALLFRVPLAREVTFADNFAGSQAKSLTASSVTAVFNVQRNGTTIGTITFSASAVGVFATTGTASEVFAAGDILSVIAPTPQDVTLANIGITFSGTR